MYYVYILKSRNHPQRYIGVTQDLKRRLHEHNSGQSRHTSKYMPWEIMLYIAFTDKNKAEHFEHYLKSGSGVAFAQRHF